jgi:hypothetical protein
LRHVANVAAMSTAMAGGGGSGVGGSGFARVAGAFFAEFHPTLGPRLSVQVPEGLVAADDFRELSDYLIPKPPLCGRLLTVCVRAHPGPTVSLTRAHPRTHTPTHVHAHTLAHIHIRRCTDQQRIVSLPVRIESARYERNMFQFNVGLVFSLSDADGAADTACYEPVVRKLARTLRTLEVRSTCPSLPGPPRPLTLLAPAVVCMLLHFCPIVCVCACGARQVERQAVSQAPRAKLEPLLADVVADLNKYHECQLSLASIVPPDAADRTRMSLDPPSPSRDVNAVCVCLCVCACPMVYIAPLQPFC